MNSTPVKPLIPQNPTCEHQVNPLGIDTPRPRLGWTLASDRRSARQTAYQVLVASSPDKLNADASDLWDTGKIVSGESAAIEYAGAGLHSRMRCCWKARVWDENDQPGGWSVPATWEMGLLKAEDWQARWIGSALDETDLSKFYEVNPSPMFRWQFHLAKRVRCARVFISGLGYHEFYLNGQKVGDHVLDPAFTRYDRRVLYTVHDITGLLVAGANACGVMLGHGWYNQHAEDVWNFHKAPWRDKPKLILQMHIEFEDGSSEVLASDAAWKVATGPIVFNGIRNGEVYDARLEKPGWCEPGYNDAAWAPVRLVAAPQGALVAQQTPIKVMQTLQPARTTEPKPGVFVVDMGQNYAGWVQLTVSGPAGTRVRLRYSERLNPDGTLDDKCNASGAKAGAFQTDTYILKGRGTEVWAPRFVYHGFQYVELTGFPGRPTPETLKGMVAYTAFESAGSFECSSELLNKIQHCARWAYISNFVGYPTDCPHREKCGWTGDAQIAAEQGLFNYDAQSAYEKWMDDIFDEQRDDGGIPVIIPTGGWGYDKGHPAWDSACILIPWYLYVYCGNRRVLERHYAGMKRYVDYLAARPFNDEGELGDWHPPFGYSSDYAAHFRFTSMGYKYCDTLVVAQVARILGKAEDAEKYSRMAAEIKKTFNGVYYNPELGLYAGGTQLAQSCALFQGLVEPRQAKKVARQLAAEVKQHKCFLNVGILGAKYLMHALTDNGYAELACRIALQTKYPSWGHWIVNGATTLWESWKPASGTHNHIMFGDVSAWFYKALGGINPDPERPGFRHIIFKPQPVGGLTWVKAEHRCPYGLIRSEWQVEGRRFHYEIAVPVNATATVHLPCADPEAVLEGGRQAAESEGITAPRTVSRRATFDLASGVYRFECDL